MPTFKPRITVTLDAQTYAVLSRFSEAVGKSQSAIAAELLASATPALCIGIKAFDLLASVAPHARQLVSRHAESLELTSEAQLKAILGRSTPSGHRNGAAGSEQASSAAHAAATSDPSVNPLPVNKGVIDFRSTSKVARIDSRKSPKVGDK